MADDIEGLEVERTGLMRLAYRMLGTVSDAEDAVQETYVRWYRLEPAERDAIKNPAAWLTRVAGRVCLDMIGSARARRERYVGPWLPEPIPSGSELAASDEPTDPLDRVTLDESISTALLVVLESLSPSERVAFVLHDVFAMPFPEIADVVGRSPEACRQLASAARRHVRERRSGAASRADHDAIVHAFAAACLTGDLTALTAVLDPAVKLRSDGGGFVSAARRPVVGADNVGRFILGLISKRPEVEVALTQTPDGASFVLRAGGRATGVLTVGVVDDRIAEIWIMLNPHKLTLWE